MLKAGIVIDNWKRHIFERHLSRAGYRFEHGPGITPYTTVLTVETNNMTALAAVVKAANDEAAKTKTPSSTGPSATQPQGESDEPDRNH